MRAARVQAQAKVNLFLLIVPGRDAQGFHHLMTLFQRIDLADEVVVRAGVPGRSIECTGTAMPMTGLGAPERNLAYRAAVEFANRAGWPDGFAIEIDKKIPVGGGLGGGSADAGGVLRALNAIAPRPLTPEQLSEAAAALGSDVPFLAGEDVQALGSGRGTQLAPVPYGPAMGGYHLLIAVPPFSIATADAYRWLEEDRTRRGVNQPGKVPALPKSEIPGSLDDVRRQLDKSMFNDFEPVVEAHHPQIRAIRERLRDKGALVARLAGSGSCVFGIFADTPPASLDLDSDTRLVHSRVSTRVVQVEVLE